MSAMIVLIPAYEPGESLVTLVEALGGRPEVEAVVVVDDGSGADFAATFDRARRAGAQVVRYLPNHGKGHALKVGFREIGARYPGRVVVCADSDGQHRIDDILRVGGEVRGDGAMVLGGRHFTGAVPVRSLLGNRVTAVLFRAVTGLRIRDTQTGLRAYPAAMLPWLRTVRGERFEYELSLLLEADQAGWGIREVPIETVYLAGNASSHFRPIRDSWRVYRPLLAFGAASLAGFVVDTVVLLALAAATGHVLLAATVARLVSATVNYLMNRHVTFGRGDGRSVVRYATLASAIFAANVALLSALAAVLPLAAAKLATEGVLLAVSYVAQRSYVFGRPRARRPWGRRAGRDGAALPGRGTTDLPAGSASAAWKPVRT